MRLHASSASLGLLLLRVRLVRDGCLPERRHLTFGSVHRQPFNVSPTHDAGLTQVRAGFVMRGSARERATVHQRRARGRRQRVPARSGDGNVGAADRAPLRRPARRRRAEIAGRLDALDAERDREALSEDG
jgi:hypothetical protein